MGLIVINLNEGHSGERGSCDSLACGLCFLGKIGNKLTARNSDERSDG